MGNVKQLRVLLLIVSSRSPAVNLFEARNCERNKLTTIVREKQFGLDGQSGCAKYFRHRIAQRPLSNPDSEPRSI